MLQKKRKMRYSQLLNNWSFIPGLDMNKKLLLTLASLFAMHFPTVSMADTSPLYMNVNAAIYDSQFNTLEPEGINLGFGVDLNNYFSFEMIAGTSNETEGVPVTNTAKINYAASGLLRFNLRFKRVTLYALGGYSKVKATNTTGVTTTVQEADGVSYGYGIDFFGTPDLALSVRRIEFIDIDDPAELASYGATMFGITYYFDTPKIHSRY